MGIKTLRLRQGKKRKLKPGMISYFLPTKYKDDWGNSIHISTQDSRNDCHIMISRNKIDRKYLNVAIWGRGWVSSIGFLDIRNK